MKNASTKLHQLETKIADLKSQYADLMEERHGEVATLIAKTDLPLLDNKTLMGGLLSLKNQLAVNPAQKEAWRDAGEKFLRKSGKRKDRSKARPRQPKP